MCLLSCLLFVKVMVVEVEAGMGVMVIQVVGVVITAAMVGEIMVGEVMVGVMVEEEMEEGMAVGTAEHPIAHIHTHFLPFYYRICLHLYQWVCMKLHSRVTTYFTVHSSVCFLQVYNNFVFQLV